MTASYVNTPFSMPRPARHRESYAASAVSNLSSQLDFDICGGTLQTSPCPVLIENVGSVYGILIYTSFPGNRYLLDYIGIGFPDKQCKKYVSRLDLTHCRGESPDRSDAEEIEDRVNVEFLTEMDPATNTTAEDGSRR